MSLKLLSSLEKCFLDEKITEKTAFTGGSFLLNERFHFGACYTTGTSERRAVTLKIVSPLADFVRVWRVQHVPVKMAADGAPTDGNYLRTAPGLYPDLLQPLPENRRLIQSGNLESLFFEIDTAGAVEAGSYPLTVQLCDFESGEVLCAAACTLEIIGAVLPPQTLLYTQWFHADCLQVQYGTQAFDERHWQIIENYMRMAVRSGINMLLTPVFTPPLDTAVGGERPTTQLVDVTVTRGSYTFGFEKLGRWIQLCDRVGIRYFEISHFFTQWGAAHAPKIMATADGTYTRLFGWDTDATGETYTAFLHAFIPALLAFMKSQNGADRRCYFHISDEPSAEHIPQYAAARRVVEDLLHGYPIMDALSNYAFYEQGIVARPIPATDHIEPFLTHGVPELWCYYCCCQKDKVSNRFLSMPSARNRVIGTQFYKYAISGFLQWGFNFYFNQFSYAPVNPFLCTDGDYFAPAGDAFTVYPGTDGQPLESLRLEVFFDALQDMRALQLCEQLYDRDFVLQLLEEGIPPITFSAFPQETAFLPAMRKRLNAAIKARL